MMTHIGGYPDHYARGVEIQLRIHRPKIFVCGHSHILKIMYDKSLDLLHINPGAAGISGFHQVRTAVRLTIDGSDIRDLEVGEWPQTTGSIIKRSFRRYFFENQLRKNDANKGN